MINVSKGPKSFELVAGHVPRSKLFTVDCALYSQIYEHTNTEKRGVVVVGHCCLSCATSMRWRTSFESFVMGLSKSGNKRQNVPEALTTLFL